MHRPKHYVPVIRRDLVGVLYHEAKHRRMPMTRLVNELLTEVLQGTKGWQVTAELSKNPVHPYLESSVS